MNKIYKKLPSGRYEPIGLETTDYLQDGIWMVSSKPYSYAKTSMLWRVGDIGKPFDLVTYSALLTIEDELSAYLLRLEDETSDEYREAKENSGGYISGKIGVYGISAADLISLMLRKITMLMDEQKSGKKNNEVF